MKCQNVKCPNTHLMIILFRNKSPSKDRKPMKPVDLITPDSPLTAWRKNMIRFERANI